MKQDEEERKRQRADPLGWVAALPESEILSFERASTLLYGCDSYSRMPALLALRDRLTTADWWKVLGQHWSVCDNIYEHRTKLSSALKDASEADLGAAMNADEKKSHAALQDTFPVYRGCYSFNQDGLSWSLNRAVATQFPNLNRYWHGTHDPLLVIGRASATRSILKLDREEEEIISSEVEVLEVLNLERRASQPKSSPQRRIP